MIVANKMKSNGEVIFDSKLVQKNLYTLTKKFTCVVVSIEESKDKEEIVITSYKTLW